MPVAVLLALAAAGCKPAAENPPPADRYWVRVGESGVTRTAFQNAFEISKTAYVHEEITRPEVLRRARTHFVNQMVDRLTLLERARELGLRISDAELDAAVDAARAGYPEGAFEEVLLESAISFETWKEELRVRLLMERTVEADLAARVSPTTEELEAFLQTPDAPEDPAGADRLLRRRNVEAAYESWLAGLQKRYPVEINVPDADPAVGPTPREPSP